VVTKEVGVVLAGVLMALVLVVANGAYLFYQVGDSVSAVSGNSIRETVGGLYTGSSIGHRIFILSQFLLLFVIIIVVLMVVEKLKSKAGLSKQNYIGKGNLKSKTDLDTLYEILKRENEISIDDIGKVFKVDLEIALGWSKVLENGGLAVIDYPRFGKPVLRLVEKEGVKKSGLIGKIKDKKKKVVEKVVDEKTQVSRKIIGGAARDILSKLGTGVPSSSGEVAGTKKIEMPGEVPKVVSKGGGNEISKRIREIDKRIKDRRIKNISEKVGKY